MNNYCNAMLILGLILSLTCLVYCSKNGSSSSDFIVNATQRNLSCKDFLRNREMRMRAVCRGEEVAILGETLSLKAPVDACYGTTICSTTLKLGTSCKHLQGCWPLLCNVTMRQRKTYLTYHPLDLKDLYSLHHHKKI